MKKLFKLILIVLCLTAFGLSSFGTVTAQTVTRSVKTDATNYYIVAEDNQTVEFAASELKEYIRKITGYIAPVYTIGENTNVPGTPIYLGKVETLNDELSLGLTGSDLKWDGYKLVPVNGGMAIASNEYRGVIYGVYEALEMVGCEWYGAYEGGEYIPQSKEINLIVDEAVTVNPDSWFRRYENEGGYMHGLSTADDERLYAYMMKLRSNNTRYNGLNYTNAVEKYDLIIMGGGHEVSDEFLTDAIFKTNPEMFVERNGERVKIAHSTNWCCNPENGAIKFLASKIAEVLRLNPRIQAYSIYGVDTAALGGTRGGWCDCDWCSQYSTGDLILYSVMNIANELKGEFPNVNFITAYYHDTLDTSSITYTKEDIPDNVYGLWAAREMCTYHTLLDETCAKNVYHKEHFDNLCEIYGDQIMINGYYGDGVLFNKGVYYNAERTIEETRYFIEKGASGYLNISCNVVGSYIYGLTDTIFYKMMWNNDFDAETYLEQHKQWYFGTDKKTADKITDLLLEITGQINKYCGYTIDCDTRYIMITDDASCDFAYQHINDIRATFPLYVELDAIFSDVLQETDDVNVKQRIGAMRCHMQMTENVAKTTAYTIEAFYHKYNGDSEKCVNAMDEAIILLNEMKSIYDSWPMDIKSGNELWYKIALGDDQINLYNWLKY